MASTLALIRVPQWTHGCPTSCWSFMTLMREPLEFDAKIFVKKIISINTMLILRACLATQIVVEFSKTPK